MSKMVKILEGALKELLEKEINIDDTQFIHDLASDIEEPILVSLWTSVEDELPKAPSDPLIQRRVEVYCKEYGQSEIGPDNDYSVQYGYYSHELKEWFIYGTPRSQSVTYWRNIFSPRHNK